MTADDFEYLAKEAANVRRAKALPLFHPDFPGVKVPGTVSVIVVPDADVKEPRPTPSEGTLRTVCAYLDARRLLTTELFVMKPTYQEIVVAAQVVAADNADLAQVHDDIVKALVDYFHPLRRRRGRRRLAVRRDDLLLARLSARVQGGGRREHHEPRDHARRRGHEGMHGRSHRAQRAALSRESMR